MEAATCMCNAYYAREMVPKTWTAATVYFLGSVLIIISNKLKRQQLLEYSTLICLREDPQWSMSCRSGLPLR